MYMLDNKYLDFEEKFKAGLNNITNGFVYQGYLIRKAEEEGALESSPYNTIAEFAKAEHGLSKETVSKFIRINERFSEGGYSDHLAEQYEEYGRSKLEDMLNFPDTLIETLSPEMTRENIREIGAAVREEAATTPIEAMTETVDEMQQSFDKNLQKAMFEYFRENPEEYIELVGENDIKDIMEVLAPPGTKAHKVRIPGVGRLILTIKGENSPIELVNLRTDEKESYAWEEMQDILKNMGSNEHPKQSWVELYGQSFPEKEEVAPAQPEPIEEQPQPAPEIEEAIESVEKEAFEQSMNEPQEEKSEADVDRGEDEDEDEEEQEEKSDETQTEEKEEEPEQNDEHESEPVDEQLPGQMAVEDYPEVMPEQVQDTKKDYKNYIGQTIASLKAATNFEDWDAVIESVEKIKSYVEKIRNLEDEQ